jgi:hypothetical protein
MQVTSLTLAIQLTVEMVVDRWADDCHAARLTKMSGDAKIPQIPTTPLRNCALMPAPFDRWKRET